MLRQVEQGRMQGGEVLQFISWGDKFRSERGAVGHVAVGAMREFSARRPAKLRAVEGGDSTRCHFPFQLERSEYRSRAGERIANRPVLIASVDSNLRAPLRQGMCGP